MVNTGLLIVSDKLRDDHRKLERARDEHAHNLCVVTVLECTQMKTDVRLRARFDI